MTPEEQIAYLEEQLSMEREIGKDMLAQQKEQYEDEIDRLREEINYLQEKYENYN